jgi:hypothetical protein
MIQFLRDSWNRLPPKSPRSVFCALFAVFFGVSVTLLGEEWYAGQQPNLVTIKHIDVRPVPDTKGARWLDVFLVGPPAKNCLRFSQHLLYKDNGSIRQYYPLGSALNGANFSSSDQEIEISLRLPYGLPQGEWWYIDRSVYTCVIWPGLIKQIQSETPPTKVVVNDALTADTTQ